MQTSELYTIINYLRVKQDKLQQSIRLLQQVIEKLPAHTAETVPDTAPEPSSVISDDYTPSTLENTDLHVLPGDTYETAISKLHKSILDNEYVTASTISAIKEELGLTENFKFNPESTDLQNKTITEAIDALRTMIG